MKYIAALLATVSLSVPSSAARQASAPAGPAVQPPISVRLVEDSYDAKRREVRESEVRSYETAILDAQLRAARASESQATAAWFGLGASAIGAALLFWTLWETRRTANAAVKSALLSESSAWPIVVGRVAASNFLYPPKTHEGEYQYSQVAVAWENVGKSPAFLVSAEAELRLSRDLPTSSELLSPVRSIDRTVIPAESKSPDGMTVKFRTLNEDEVRSTLTGLKQGGVRFFLIGKVVYEDQFGVTHHRGFCMKIFRDGSQRRRGGPDFNFHRRDLASVQDVAETED